MGELEKSKHLLWLTKLEQKQTAIKQEIEKLESYIHECREKNQLPKNRTSHSPVKGFSKPGKNL